MRTYLATLHKRPPHHKKRFALLTSLAFTLSIFTVWSVVKFDAPKGTVAAEGPSRGVEVRDITPLGSLRMSLAAAFQAFRNDSDEMKKGLEVINTYGR